MPRSRRLWEGKSVATTPRETVPTVRQVSAGGVVARQTAGGGFEIAVILTLAERRWQLPKGLIDEGETPEQAALREVREESGVDAELVAPIETIDYWYFADRSGRRVRYHKSVHFYLMRFVGGQVEDHDNEVEESRWVDIDDAVGMLAFKSEKEVVAKAREMLNACQARDAA